MLVIASTAAGGYPLDQVDDRVVPLTRHRGLRPDRAGRHDDDSEPPLEVAPGVDQTLFFDSWRKEVESQVGVDAGDEVGVRLDEAHPLRAGRPPLPARQQIDDLASGQPSSAACTRKSFRTSCGRLATRSIERWPAVTRPSCWRWRSA